MVSSALAKFVHPEPLRAPETTKPWSAGRASLWVPLDSCNWQGDTVDDRHPPLPRPRPSARSRSWTDPGQWGTYKTFVAIDLAMAVIAGPNFIRFPVRRRGGVLFIACEGQSEVAVRINAAAAAREAN